VVRATAFFECNESRSMAAKSGSKWEAPHGDRSPPTDLDWPPNEYSYKVLSWTISFGAMAHGRPPDWKHRFAPESQPENCQ
jgi:hypothetical protein